MGVEATADFMPQWNVASSVTVNDADTPEPQSMSAPVAPLRLHATFVQLAALLV